MLWRSPSNGSRYSGVWNSSRAPRIAYWPESPRVLEEVTCPAGAVIMEAGAVEDWLFVVEHGEVEVIRPDRRVLMGVGSVVGELAVLDARPRSATVVALSPVRLLRLRKAVFDDALDAQPEIARGVIADLARRLRETHQPVS